MRIYFFLLSFFALFLLGLSFLCGWGAAPISHISSSPVPSSILQKKTDSPLSVNREKVQVVRVIDGDTVELDDGRRVRYIGIDTPETVDPRKTVQCFGR